MQSIGVLNPIFPAFRSEEQMLRTCSSLATFGNKKIHLSSEGQGPLIIVSQSLPDKVPAVWATNQAIERWTASYLSSGV